MFNIKSELIKKCYEDKEITINDNSYKLLTISHQVSLKIIGYGQEIASEKALVGSDTWIKLEKELLNSFSYDDEILSKIPNHFDKHKKDYFTFISYGIAVISYPFFQGSLIG